MGVLGLYVSIPRLQGGVMIFCAMLLPLLLFHLDASHLQCLRLYGSVCLPMNTIIWGPLIGPVFYKGCAKLMHVGPSCMLSLFYLAELKYIILYVLPAVDFQY